MWGKGTVKFGRLIQGLLVDNVRVELGDDVELPLGYDMQYPDPGDMVKFLDTHMDFLVDVSLMIEEDASLSVPLSEFPVFLEAYAKGRHARYDACK